MSCLSLLETKQGEIEHYIENLDDIHLTNYHVTHLSNLIRAFEIELTNIKNRKHARLYRKKARDYNKYLKQCEKDIQWMSMHGHGQNKESNNRKSGEFTSEKIEMSQDVAIKYGKKLQLESENIADKALQDLEATKQIAVDTAIKVDEQTHQISKMDQELSKIDDEMERASKTLKRMSKKVMTDKYIWCCLVLVIIAIIVIVVIQFVDFKLLSKEISSYV